MIQPPKLDHFCYYHNPAEPPCVQTTVNRTEIYALATAWAVKMALSVLISFIALTVLATFAGLYYMTIFHLNYQKSIWLEGTSSRFYLTQAGGHEAPTLSKIMREIYFPWVTRLGLPYFEMLPCCCNIRSSDEMSAFVDGHEVEAQNEPLEPPSLPINAPLTTTSNTSSSSEAGSADHAGGERKLSHQKQPKALV